MKIFKITFGAVLVLIIFSCGFLLLSQPVTNGNIVKPVVFNFGEDKVNTFHLSVVAAEPPAVKNTELLFGGDVMLSRVVGQQIVKNDDFAWPFRNIANLTDAADIFVINLESPFLKNAGNYLVKTGSFSFKADPLTIAGLNLSGVDIVSLANNHFDNQGQAGMSDTFSVLEDNGIAYIGAGKNFTQAHQGKVMQVNGLKFGFLGYAYPETSAVATPDSPGFANMDIVQAQADIEAFKKQVDVLAIIMHAGTEYISYPIKFQEDFARAAIDAGADLVVGHHPHWVQETEIYKGKPILYSLGNLVFDQMWSTETQQGALAKFIFSNSELTSIEIIPIHIYDYGQADVVQDQTEKQEILNRMGLEGELINF